MNLSKFEEVNISIRIAETQPEYITVPAFYNKEEGSLVYCFELSEEEIEIIIATKKIWFKQLTGGGAMQPVHPSVYKRQLI